MVDRRVFVAGAAAIAVTPALRLLPPDVAAPALNVMQPVFMIDGWSVQDDGGPHSRPRATSCVTGRLPLHSRRQRSFSSRASVPMRGGHRPSGRRRHATARPHVGPTSWAK